MDPGAVLVFVAGGTLAIGAVALAVWYEAKQGRARNELWRGVAEGRKGRFTEGRVGAFVFDPPTVDAVVGHAVVRLDLLRVQSGKNSVLYTRARSDFALGAGPVFDVYAEGIFQSIGKALGAQDVALGGDARFDEDFVVKCDDADATRAAWTSDAKWKLRSDLPTARVTSDGTTVEAKILGPGLEPPVLEALLDVVGALASAGTAPLAGYAALEGARLEAAKGPFARPKPPRLSFETPRGEVRAELLPASGPPRLRLRVAHARELPTFSADVRAGSAAGLPRGLVTERAQAILARLEEVTLAGDATSLQLTFRAAPAPEVAAQGVALLAELAGGAPSEGAFR